MTTGPGSGLPSVALPESGDGSRRARHGSKRPRRRRRLPWRTMAIVVVIAALLGAIGWVVVSMVLSSDDDGGSATTSTTASVGDLAGETFLLLETDADGALSAATLLVVGEDGRGGDVVYVPPGLLAEVPSLGLVAIRDAHREGGDALVRQALENLFGQPFSSAAALDPAGITDLVAPAGVLTVQLSAPVERQDPATGRVDVVFPAGEVAVTPDEVPSLLESPGASDLDRLARHQGFWDGLLAAVGTGGASLSGDVAPYVAALAEGEVVHRLLPVSAVASEGELYQPEPAGLEALLADVLPGATPPAQRVRVQILNGTGEPGLAQQVQPLLVPIGADVVLTDNADRFDHATTQVVFYDDAFAAAASSVRDALGVGEVVRSRSPLDVVDVTVVVGADFLSRDAGTPASTTTTAGARS